MTKAKSILTSLESNSDGSGKDLNTQFLPFILPAANNGDAF
jgi:hypothetical protein